MEAEFFLFLNREHHYKHFKGEVKSMFNAVFEETLGILNMHFISKNGQNSKICYGTYFLHITLKLTAKNMIFL